MTVLFYVSSAVAVVSTLLVVTRREAVHALLYLIVSFLAVAAVFYALGAPFLAALEIIVYAGAILVLFVFVIMMLNLRSAAEQEKRWMHPRIWIGPGLLALVLVGQMAYVLVAEPEVSASASAVAPREVGALLFGPYLIGVEAVSMLLLAGIVGAFHLSRRGPA
jgi:NADH-quinone oxidoreductase subunit J